MGTLIKGGKVVSAAGTKPADVLIEGETIAQVAPGIKADGHTVVDATGMLVMPGGIDVHTHLDMPFGGTVSADDYEWGTRAAAIGGTTMVIDFALQSMGHPMSEAFKTWRAKSEGKACIDYGLHMAVTDLGPNDAWLDEVDAMVAAGITSFKIFMAYPNVLMVNDRTIYKLMERTKKLGALVCVHAENGTVIDAIVQEALAAGNTAPLYHALTRPVEAEAEAVHRVVAISELAGGAKVYIVHVSNEKAMLRGEGGARTRASGAWARRARSTWCCPRRRHGQARLRGCEVRVHAATAREEEPGAAVGCAEGRRAAGGFDRPLSVPVCRSEDAGTGELHQDSQWRPGD